MADKFPKDCWDKDCEYFKVWDMSVDDLCCACKILWVECDLIDEDFSSWRCPLDWDYIKTARQSRRARPR